MSLNAKQMEQTRFELKKNFEISGLSTHELIDELGFSSSEFERTIALGRGVNPENVWRLRDCMERHILASGKPVYPYSALVENIYYPY